MAKNRTYAYVIYNSRSKPLFFNNYAHWEKTPLDFEILKSEGKTLLGTHDFSSFRSSSCSARNPIKDITSFKAEKFNNFIVMHITANAFLHNMVRIIMGTLADISKNENKMTIKDIIDAKDRNFAGRTLSAKGLFFLGPKYDDLYKITEPLNNVMDKLKI
jgi:tRNA pseudouridine38-40 synthase